MTTLSIQQQADFVHGLVGRCRMRDGQPAGETWLRLTRDEVEALEGLRARLDRMAPFEVAIRKVVTGR